MRKNSKINWNSDFSKKTFQTLGLSDASKFWKLKDGDIEGQFVPIKKLSSHAEKNLYSTVYIKINKSKYRFKRASGKYFEKLMHEHKIIKVLPYLHITPPSITAYSVDKENKQCFFLFKYPPGFTIIKNLLEYKLHPSIIADFEVRKQAVMRNISRSIHKMYYSNYYYPHWYSDHIMVKNQSDEIAIIDLEDFRHLEDCPWYYRLEFCSWLIRQKQWHTLHKSFPSGVFTKKYMKTLIKKKRETI